MPASKKLLLRKAGAWFKEPDGATPSLLRFTSGLKSMNFARQGATHFWWLGLRRPRRLPPRLGARLGHFRRGQKQPGEHWRHPEPRQIDALRVSLEACVAEPGPGWGCAGRLPGAPWPPPWGIPGAAEASQSSQGSPGDPRTHAGLTQQRFAAKLGWRRLAWAGVAQSGCLALPGLPRSFSNNS